MMSSVYLLAPGSPPNQGEICLLGNSRSLTIFVRSEFVRLSRYGREHKSRHWTTVIHWICEFHPCRPCRGI